MTTVAIVGLGYVGLPLALEFGKHIRTIGIDIDRFKIDAYIRQVDPAGEVTKEQFEESKFFSPNTNFLKLREADFIIVTMPTPVDANNEPDFSYIIKASQAVGLCMKKGATVIYESTVHPGATEEICVPVLEGYSKMKWKEGFHVGYSPERISPGDKNMTVTKLKKIVSGDTQETLERIEALYSMIIEAGVYCASSIRVAEAAKVVENIQRDVNIALMNELSMIFHKLDIDTNEVIDAAATKWNFANYRPGLVGGHCIGVDPYYLIHKALEANHVPNFLNQARAVNNSMAKYVVRETTKDLKDPRGMKVGVLGLTFKENCQDIRNSKVFDLINEYKNSGMEVFAYDPIANEEEIEKEYGIKPCLMSEIPDVDVLVLASPHTELLELLEFAMLPLPGLRKLKQGGLFVDIKGKVAKDKLDAYGIRYWRL